MVQSCYVCFDCGTSELGKVVSGCSRDVEHVAHVKHFQAVHFIDQVSERVDIKFFVSVASEVIQLQLLDAPSVLA